MARKKKEAEPAVETVEQAPEEKQLSPQEQLEAMRLYVQSMQKVQGHSNEEVRNIIHSIHKRIILVLNYSGLDDATVKPLKVQLEKIVKEEQERYKDE